MGQFLFDLIFKLKNWGEIRKEENRRQEADVQVQPETPEVKPVEIVIDRAVRTKYQAGWIDKVRKVAPTDFVVHGTAGGMSVNGLLNWMLGGEFASNWMQGIGLFHYAIGRGEKGEAPGLTVEVIDPAYWVHHATAGGKAPYQIGVELLNPSKSNRESYIIAQYESLFKLYFDHLLPLYPSMRRIVGHRWSVWNYCSPATAAKYDKYCPGAGFDWGMVKQAAEARGFQIKDIGSEGKEGYELV
jgi:hypothetical protein